MENGWTCVCMCVCIHLFCESHFIQNSFYFVRLLEWKKINAKENSYSFFFSFSSPPFSHIFSTIFLPWFVSLLISHFVLPHSSHTFYIIFNQCCRVVSLTLLTYFASHLICEQHCFPSLSIPLQRQQQKREKLIPFTRFLVSSKVRKLLNSPTSIRNKKTKKREKSPLKFVTANQLHGFFFSVDAWHFICVTFFLLLPRFVLVLNYCLSSFNDFFSFGFLLLFFFSYTGPWLRESTLSIERLHVCSRFDSDKNYICA